MTKISNEKLDKFSIWVRCGVLILSVMIFWFGLSFLKTEVFPHYFNADKHVIVKQNNDTKEVLAWKDTSGNVYTPEDAQVKNFAWGATFLLLITMIFAIGSYNGVMKVSRKTLLEIEQEILRRNLPDMQAKWQ